MKAEVVTHPTAAAVVAMLASVRMLNIEICIVFAGLELF